MSTLADDLTLGLENAIAYVRGDRTKAREHVVRVAPEIDVKALRQRLGMTQQEFAAEFSFSVRSVQNWEQGRRAPEGPARALLNVIAYEPEAVQRALHKAQNP